MAGISGRADRNDQPRIMFNDQLDLGRFCVGFHIIFKRIQALKSAAFLEKRAGSWAV